MFSNMPVLYKEFQRLDGQQVTLTITKRIPRRSLPQNAYLWGVVYRVIATFTGDTDEAIHDAMGREFLSYRDDKGLQRVRSTTELSTEEFAEYVEQVRAWAATFLNLPIPDPQ